MSDNNLYTLTRNQLEEIVSQMEEKINKWTKPTSDDKDPTIATTPTTDTNGPPTEAKPTTDTNGPSYNGTPTHSSTETAVRTTPGTPPTPIPKPGSTTKTLDERQYRILFQCQPINRLMEETNTILP